MFSKLVSTPIAGSKLNSRLRALLLAHGSYAPPPSSLNSMTIPEPARIPPRVLTDELVEEIKTRCCFVGDEIMDDERLLREYDDELYQRYRREASTAATSSSSAMDVDTPATPSLSTFDAEEEDPSDPDSPLLKYLCNRYSRTCPSTTSLSFSIPHLSAPPSPSGIGKGHLSIPGWIRERAAEVLFDSTLETRDSLSIQSTILECVLELPIDLRRPMVENMIVTGGTASMPGFIPRLKHSLLTRLRESHPPSPPPSPSIVSESPDSHDVAKRIRRDRLSNRLHNLRHSPRYASLVPLASSLSILNNPAPVPYAAASSSSTATRSEGSAPAFSPALYAWVGGSLAGSLKVGGEELAREDWDEGNERAALTRARDEHAGEGIEGDESSEREGGRRERRGTKLQDWSRTGYA